MIPHRPPIRRHHILRTKSKTNARVGDHRARPMSKPTTEPDVLGVRVRAAGLLAQDGYDGRDAAEGEAAVAAVAGKGRPGAADPVVGEEGG